MAHWINAAWFNNNDCALFNVYILYLKSLPSQLMCPDRQYFHDLKIKMSLYLYHLLLLNYVFNFLQDSVNVKMSQISNTFIQMFLNRCS